MEEKEKSAEDNYERVSAYMENILEAIKAIAKNNGEHPYSAPKNSLYAAYQESFEMEQVRQEEDNEFLIHGLSPGIKFPTGETTAPELAFAEIIEKVISFIAAVKQAGLSQQQVEQIIFRGAAIFARREEDRGPSLLFRLRKSTKLRSK